MTNKPDKTSPHHQKLVAHIMSTYEKKYGHPYPFRSIDGKSVKWVLGVFSDFNMCRALWDVYLDNSWNFTDTKTGEYVKYGHTIPRFEWKIDRVLDLDWKSRKAKYDNEEPNIKIDVKLQVFPKSPSVIRNEQLMKEKTG